MSIVPLLTPYGSVGTAILILLYFVLVALFYYTAYGALVKPLGSKKIFFIDRMLAGALLIFMSDLSTLAVTTIFICSSRLRKCVVSEVISLLKR